MEVTVLESQPSETVDYRVQGAAMPIMVMVDVLARVHEAVLANHEIRKAWGIQREDAIAQQLRSLSRLLAETFNTLDREYGHAKHLRDVR